MKKIIITGIVIAACVVLCAALWPRNAEDKVIPVTQGKPTVSANVAATQEEPLHIIFSADTQSPGPAETKESTTEKEQASSPPDEAILEPEVTSTPEPTSTPSSVPKPTSSSAPSSSDPKPGTIAVIDGNRCMWIPASAGSRMREAAPKEQRSAVPAMSLPATKSDKCNL
jgi:hypothetical protein